jgi:CzcA family heavy metal efflux pump
VTNVQRLTFSAFPIMGISLTSDTRDITELWQTAYYDLKPRLLRIRGVARVDLVGGRRPEFQVIVDQTRLDALHLSLPDVTRELEKTNFIASVGLHEEKNTLFLAVVDGRVRTIAELEAVTVSAPDDHPVHVRDFARVVMGPEPAFNVVTAEGLNAVLLNVRSQPDGSTLDIAHDLDTELATIRKTLPPDMKLAFFYDQSLLVRESVGSVWEAIGFGLILSVVILYAFLRSWGTTLVATLVIPITVLFTLVVVRLAGMSFNLMTLGGIAAAIGLVVDDAIVVVEAIHTKLATTRSRADAVRDAIAEILAPLVGSTLTPVVVFIPLAFLDGLQGVFFRALATTMVVALLTSLVLAVTVTPTLATWIIQVPAQSDPDAAHHPATTRRGPLAAVTSLYEAAMRRSLRRPAAMLVVAAAVLGAGILLYGRLESDFLPAMDEGAFVIDYFSPPGTSLTETDRALREAEKILRAVPEVESYSRRTGARLALAISEPNRGDYLVKLRPKRKRPTADVIADVRRKLNAAEPVIHWEFPGILGDLIGDLMWAPKPIEIKLYSPDVEVLKKLAPHVQGVLDETKGVVDTFDGLVIAGPSLAFRVRSDDAQRFGMDADDVARAVNTAMLGQTASSVLQGDRVLNVRVRLENARTNTADRLSQLVIRAPNGNAVRLSQVADLVEEPGALELRREDLRQDVAVTARLEGRDLGSAMTEIRKKLEKDPLVPRAMIEYGGLYEQQQESFKNLAFVLAAAIVLVFTVLLIEFRSFREPLAILFGAILAMFGSVVALWATGTSLNIISFLGAIIGVGIVAKNGILMLDLVAHIRDEGGSLEDAVIHSGRRRLRPVLMTSLACALGMLPLAWGIGRGADMLKPLAIAVMGSLLFSVVLSLVATPTIYFMLARAKPSDSRERDHQTSP